MNAFQIIFFAYFVIVIIEGVTSNDYLAKKTLNSFIDVFAQSHNGRPTFGEHIRI